MGETAEASRYRWIAERDADRALALLAAPAPAREAVALLFILDLRLGAVADRPGEQAATLLRLAWWRDALTALDTAAPPPEPMLRDLATLVLPHGLGGEALAQMAEGWLAFAEDDGTAGQAMLDEHALERGTTLFTLAARLCGAEDDRIGAAGAAWALAERARRTADPAVARRFVEAARARFGKLGGGSWPRRLRALSTLVVLARHDLAGDSRRSPASRLLRAFSHRLTGR
jgi:phytoene synthase